MQRATFLIDGFNLYHSVVEAGRILQTTSIKWLDIKSLCQSYLYLLGKDITIDQIHYFSALAEHLRTSDPGKVKRHQLYIECLESTGVKVHLGRFKQKEVWCNQCQKFLVKHEEKETDVAISVALMESFFLKTSDIAVLVTGDTDLAPAVRSMKRLFPGKKIYFLFPFNRKNKELQKLADGAFKINKETYRKHQLSDPVELRSGKQLFKPKEWQ